MSENNKLSQTMRIDLIPDVPSEPVKGKKKRVVISAPTRKHKPVIEDVVEEEGNSGYKELLQSVYDAALIADFSGQIADVNVRAVEFLQYPRDELCRMTIFEVISGSDESLIRTLCENLENERFTLIEAYCVRKDGSFFPSEIAVNKLHLDKMQLCFFIRDITVRRQREEMLRTEHNAIQNSGNGIAITNLESELEYANPAVVRLWGYASSEELLGVNVRDLLHDAGAADDITKAVLGQRPTWTGDLVARRRDGTIFEVQVSAACNKNSDGEPVGIIFSFTDISDRKRAEEAERTAERHRVMLESLGAACHHLGQPATVLLANLGIIEKRIDGDDELVRELVKTSIEAAETLGQILHKLNMVNEYKTTQYLEKPEGADTEENRILEI